MQRALFVLGVVALISTADLATGATSASFEDETDSGYTLMQWNLPPAPTILPIGPTGNFLRLAATAAPNVGTISFELTDPGAFEIITAEFDFRMTPGDGRAGAKHMPHTLRSFLLVGGGDQFVGVSIELVGVEEEHLVLGNVPIRYDFAQEFVRYVIHSRAFVHVVEPERFDAFFDQLRDILHDVSFSM